MSIKNGDLPAMPAVLEELIGRSGNEQHYGDVKYAGMTKREQFAMAMAQGILSSGAKVAMTKTGVSDFAHDAAVLADALLAELERTK